MRNLPIECLRSFATVAEVKGFTQAGQLLGKSQPAVSLQIKRLEELIGAQVFVRGSHRLELTQPGERMLAYARQILALNDEALAELALPVISGRVRFGIPSEYATILLPKVLGRFAHSYPAVTLEIPDAGSYRLRYTLQPVVQNADGVNSMEIGVPPVASARWTRSAICEMKATARGCALSSS